MAMKMMKKKAAAPVKAPKLTPSAKPRAPGTMAARPPRTGRSSTSSARVPTA